MPPKSSAAKEKDLAGEEDVLQAVILADSFNNRFRPLTQNKPRVRVINLLLRVYTHVHSAYCPSAMHHYWIGLLNL